MANRYTTIGFDVRDPAGYTRLLMTATDQGQLINSRNGYYIRWSPGGGAELWVRANTEREVIGCAPHFAGEASTRLRVIEPIRKPGAPLAGGFVCVADPGDASVHRSALTFAIEAPDFDLIHRRLRHPAPADCQLAAFARELACFEDDGQFERSRGAGIKHAAESFASAALPADAPPDQPPAAEVMLAGHVLQADTRVNPFSRRMFYALRVECLGIMLDVLADPEIVVGTPRAGGVVHGTCWLSGRISAGGG